MDGKEILSSCISPSQDKGKALQQVIGEVLGDRFLSGVFPLSLREGQCEVLGFVGAASQARQNRTGQYLFVNRRSVQSSEINRAIDAGYGSRLPPRAHPVFVLHLTLPPHWIDVNVHPQKKEIRLLKTGAIEQLLRHGIVQAFREEEGMSIHRGSHFEKVGSWTDDMGSDFILREDKEPVSPLLLTQHLPVIALFFHYLMLDAQFLALPMVGSEGIVLVDLKLAEQLIVFEALLSRFEKGDEMQTLLFPTTFECSAHEQGQILYHFKTLRQMGIAIRPFGEKVFVIDAIDPHLEEERVVDLVNEIISVLEEFRESHHLEKKQKKTLTLRMIRFARFQKKEYSMEQARAIVKQLFQMPSPHRGPTGECVYVYLSRDAIKKFFH